MQWQKLLWCSLGFDPKNDPQYPSGVWIPLSFFSEIYSIRIQTLVLSVFVLQTQVNSPPHTNLAKKLLKK